MAKRYKLDDSAAPSPTQSSINYEAELNKQQLAAVRAQNGASLVIAGAGSGKTRTLTYRVAWLLDQGVAPEHILLLTFTNKAAKEMADRVRALVPINLDLLWSGTFHSIANRILRRHATKLGYSSSFSIMDSDDSKSLIRSIIKELGFNTKGLKFPKGEVLLALLSLTVNTGADLHDLILDKHPYFDSHIDGIKQVIQTYIARKKESNSMDFDDLLCNVVSLLERDSELRELYSRKFSHILVDEYQDTNTLQLNLIDLLASTHGNLMVVGDDAQSIYSWRGANMENIITFHTKYPTATTYKVETNYRSVPAILSVSNAAIANNKSQIKKKLRASRKDDTTSTPVLVALNDERTQARFVAQRVSELVKEGVDPTQIAILYRAHYQSMNVQMELVRAKLPFRITSGVRFFEQAHIKDVLSFLRFFSNPKDAISFKRFVLMLNGIGLIASEKIWRAWLDELLKQHNSQQQHENPLTTNFSLLTSMKIPSKAQKEWGIISNLLTSFDQTMHPSEMIGAIIKEFYEDYIHTEFEDSEQRLQDLEHMARFANSFATLDEFLSQMSLMSNTDEQHNSATEEQHGKASDHANNSITLSTIHQAKGLEWQVVFLIGLTEGAFPHQRAIENSNRSALEEERRLFYVAITRAKDQLYLSYPRYNSQGGYYSEDYNLGVSRFLKEIPIQLLDEWQVC